MWNHHRKEILVFSLVHCEYAHQTETERKMETEKFNNTRWPSSCKLKREVTNNPCVFNHNDYYNNINNNHKWHHTERTAPLLPGSVVGGVRGWVPRCPRTHFCNTIIWSANTLCIDYSPSHQLYPDSASLGNCWSCSIMAWLNHTGK